MRQRRRGPRDDVGRAGGRATPRRWSPGSAASWAERPLRQFGAAASAAARARARRLHRVGANCLHGARLWMSRSGSRSTVQCRRMDPVEALRELGGVAPVGELDRARRRRPQIAAALADGADPQARGTTGTAWPTPTTLDARRGRGTGGTASHLSAAQHSGGSSSTTRSGRASPCRAAPRKPTGRYERALGRPRPSASCRRNVTSPDAHGDRLRAGLRLRRRAERGRLGPARGHRGPRRPARRRGAQPPHRPRPRRSRVGQRGVAACGPTRSRPCLYVIADDGAGPRRRAPG